MAYLLAVAAALANAVTTILQRMGVETAPAKDSLRLSLVAHALRRKVWLAGFVCMAGAFLLQFVALHFGRLSTVQPILTLELPFLVVILGGYFHLRLSWMDWIGALAAAGGLAAFLALAQPGGGVLVPDTGSWLLVGGAVVGAVVICLLLTRTGSPPWRSAMFGVAGAIVFAFTAALMKEMNGQINHGWSTVFLHFPPYAVVVSGLIGTFLALNAYHAGPITASQAALVIVDPLASIAIGVGLFGDRLVTSGLRGPGEAVALSLLFTGVYSLTQSPLVARVRSEDDRGQILSERLHGEHSVRTPRADPEK